MKSAHPSVRSPQRDCRRSTSLLYALALLAGFAAALSVGASRQARGGEGSTKLPDVVERYRQSTERITARYAIEAESTATQEYKGASQRSAYVYHCRRDKDLIDVRVEQFGVDSEGNRSASPTFRRTAIINGKNEMFFYDGPEGKAPYVSYSAFGSKHRDSVRAQLSSVCGVLDGYLANDTETAGEVFGKQEDVTVRPEKEKIGEYLCYVVDGQTKDHGRYTLWLDADHGCLPRKAVVLKSGEDSYCGNPLTKLRELPALRNLAKIEWSMNDAEIESTNGVFTPVSFKCEEVWEGSDGAIQRVSAEYTRTKIDLNPDFDAIGAFTPDLPDGTAVNCEDGEGAVLLFQWKGGRVITSPPVPGEAAGRLEPAAAQFASPVGKPLPDMSGFAINPPIGEATNRPLLVCFVDADSRPSRQIVKDLASRAGDIKDRGVTVILVNADAGGADKARELASSAGLSCSVGAIAKDAPGVLAGWGAPGLPWLVLADSNHIVIAAGGGMAGVWDKMESITVKCAPAMTRTEASGK